MDRSEYEEYFRKLCGTSNDEPYSLDESLKILNLTKYCKEIKYLLMNLNEQPYSNEEYLTAVLSAIAKNKWDMQTLDKLIKATFPAGVLSEQYDLDQCQTNKATVELLMKDTWWIKDGTNIVMFGGPGQGKTLLAVELGKVAVRQGYTTLFSNARLLFEKLKKQEVTYGDRPIGSFYSSQVLIIDDIGHARPEHDDVSTLFFRLIDWRVSEGRSTIITSNTQPNEWIMTLGGSEHTQKAALDRILYKTKILAHTGEESLRFLKFKEFNKDILN